ncbi:hypothetical protein ATCC90586_010483 [Pythium insidiosum]|nr:hypothetical protein ATCC90586_010483 [Pythium insidiosum]
MQGDPGELRPTRYVGRVLKDNERKFSPAEREVLALLRVLDVCYTLLAGKPIRAPIPTLKAGDESWVVSFDGSAKSRRQGGSCGVVLWKTTDWTVVDARSWAFPDATVNEAEYRGWNRRAFNAAADYITSLALQRGDGETIGEDGHAALQLLNRLPEAQDEERWIVNLKRFLANNVAELDAGETADCSKLASSYEAVDGLLYFVGSRVDRGEDGRLASVKAYV